MGNDSAPHALTDPSIIRAPIDSGFWGHPRVFMEEVDALTVNDVREPGTLSMVARMVIGTLLLGGRKRRRQRLQAPVPDDRN